MSKPAKSQWDFGELFPPAETRKILSVWELTSDIKRLLEKQIGSVWVSGEITNLRAQSSGHCYFTLKDVAAQLSCVLFRGTPSAQRQLLADGQKVLLQGEVTVYEARGQYQLIVRAVELQGVGALQAAFEKLKQKLAAAGWFAPERKRPLPRCPQRIGLVTSPTGAAIRDVLHVVQRRNPALEMILVPCRVQGDGAAAEIAAAIQLLNEFSAAGSREENFPKPSPLEPLGGGSRREGALSESPETKLEPPQVGGCEIHGEPRPPKLAAHWDHEPDFDVAGKHGTGKSREPAGWKACAPAEIQGERAKAGPAPSGKLDLILITRGGGSLEDLWAFNEEIVARAIFESAVPVVSAVGHEIDFSIADFVADLRAATPSAAAEILTEGVFASREFVLDAPLRLRHLARRHWERKAGNLETVAARVARLHPRRRLDESYQRLDDLQSGLLRNLKQAARARGLGLQNLAGRFFRARPSSRLPLRREALRQLEKRWHALGPDQVLARGYSLTTDAATGRVLRDAAQVSGGQKLKTRLAKGEVISRVEPESGK
jgi:exonuclease VII large subunit